jgi:hypothetical protein
MFSIATRRERMELRRLHAIVRALAKGQDTAEMQRLAQSLSVAERQAIGEWKRQQRRAAAEGKGITPQGKTVVWDRSSAIPSPE